MWTVDSQDFVRLRDGTGIPFTKFVDSLIQAQGYILGVGESSILTCQRNVRDGGVDTEVTVAMPGDTTGFLRDYPTCWQYKGRRARDITDAVLIGELKGAFVRILIQKGYAYRFAICDEISPPKRAEWKEKLAAEIHAINPNAPPPEIVTASQLASWANAYPSVVAEHFGFDTGKALHFAAWSRNTKRVTPDFVMIDRWQAAVARIERHVDFDEATTEAGLSLQGMAGVGKTRLVYEIAATKAGRKELVLYAPEGEDAEDIAVALANNTKTRCILVADECSAASRLKITRILKGHSDRVRVICIDNAGERRSDNEELWLSDLDARHVEEVLAKNFPRVLIDRRREYAAFSGGYIRFAADLCEHDAEIQSKGHFGPGLGVVQDYYLGLLLTDGQRRIVEAISLVRKVGFAGNIAQELDDLAQLTRLNANEMREAAAVLKDAPGFIARTTRYLYVSPDIVAGICFEKAWNRWIEGDPDTFLSNIPKSLLASFQSRAAHSGTPEVRARVAQFFWSSTARLKPGDLADVDAVERLTTLVDTEPAAYFPVLVDLVSRATIDELHESRRRGGGHGTRRTLVWTAERMAGFPEYFRQSETMLRRLAIAETETGISNNATGVWKELFRIQLSGTSVPFSERIAMVDALLASADAAERALALEALKESLHFTGTRLVGPVVIAGRLVPPDWYPKNYQEFADCIRGILGVFGHLFEQSDAQAKETAWPLLAHHVRQMLGYGLLDELRTLFAKHTVPEPYLPDVLESIDDYLQYECGGKSGDAPGPEFKCDETRQWLETLIPQNVLGRLRSVVGKDPWHHSIREELNGIPSAFVPLAQELVDDPGKFEEALPFLNSGDAPSAALLGDALARVDLDGKYLDQTFRAAIAGSATGFIRGYIARLLILAPGLSKRVNTWLDHLETEAPVVAYWVALVAPSHVAALERTFRMIDKGAIPIQSLQQFVVGELFDHLTPRDFVTVVDRLADAGDKESSHIAVDFLGHAGQRQRHLTPEEIDAAWRVLENSARFDDRAHYWWTMALEQLSPRAPERACDIAIVALTGDDYDKSDKAWSVLAHVASSNPALVMAKIGALMLSQDNAWRFSLKARGGVFHAMPVDVVAAWLDNAGIDGARAIASHLITPTVDSNGQAVVSPLTAFVLSRWGDDEEVFGRFTAATHHLQLYTGDMAANHRREAERARPLLSHPIAAIRRWAQHEVETGESQARHWELRNEEQDLPK